VAANKRFKDVVGIDDSMEAGLIKRKREYVSLYYTLNTHSISILKMFWQF